MSPACSPTASMSVIIRGKTPEEASGPEMVVPSVTRWRAVLSASPITALLQVSSQILSAWRTFTPFERSVFRVYASDEYAPAATMP